MTISVEQEMERVSLENRIKMLEDALSSSNERMINLQSAWSVVNLRSQKREKAFLDIAKLLIEFHKLYENGAKDVPCKDTDCKGRQISRECQDRIFKIILQDKF